MKDLNFYYDGRGWTVVRTWDYMGVEHHKIIPNYWIPVRNESDDLPATVEFAVFTYVNTEGYAGLTLQDYLTRLGFE